MGDFEKLELSTETLRALSAEELEQAAGGVAPPTLDNCLTGDYTRWCPTFPGTCTDDTWQC
jgi:hypothetical protein